MTIRELIEEQRRRLNSGTPAEGLAAALLFPGVLAKQLTRLADRRIGQLLLDEVWPRLSPLGPESTICLQAVDRRRGSATGRCANWAACPRCGSEMLIHYGVGAPGFREPHFHPLQKNLILCTPTKRTSRSSCRDILSFCVQDVKTELAEGECIC